MLLPTCTSHITLFISAYHFLLIICLIKLFVENFEIFWRLFCHVICKYLNIYLLLIIILRVFHWIHLEILNRNLVFLFTSWLFKTSRWFYSYLIFFCVLRWWSVRFTFFKLFWGWFLSCCNILSINLSVFFYSIFFYFTLMF